MAELAAVGDIVWAKQDAYFPMKLGVLTLPSTSWPTGDPVGRQIPTQIIALAFLGINVAIDRFLADTQTGAIQLGLLRCF